MPRRRIARFALGAVLVGIALFIASWFVPDPWDRGMSWTPGDAMRAASIVLWSAAFVLGVIGWRGNTSAKVAVGLAAGVPALVLFIVATAEFQ